MTSRLATLGTGSFVTLSENEWFGMAFDETNDIKLGQKDAQENVLYDADGNAVMKLVAIYDQAHWNWKLEAKSQGSVLAFCDSSL